LLSGSTEPERVISWKRELHKIDPEKVYKAYHEALPGGARSEFYEFYERGYLSYLNLINVAGEFLRKKQLFTDSAYVDFSLTMQLRNFSAHGQVVDKHGTIREDVLTRAYLVSMLERGYDSFVYNTYRELLWRGAWNSLLSVDPAKEYDPVSIAAKVLIFELYSSAYHGACHKYESGAFKRAANMMFMKLREKDERLGSRRDSLLACAFIAKAWMSSSEYVEEKASPIDVN